MSMTQDQIKEKVQDIICNQLGIEKEKVVESASFTKDLGADSLDVVELVMAFEEEFSIDIDDDKAGQMQTVENVIEYISKEV